MASHQIIAIVLAATLVVSAIAKLADLDQSRRSLTAMGVPTPKLAAVLVPLAELAVAAGLLVAPVWGAIAAFGLLATFTAVLWSLYRSGSAVPCHCFGALSKGPVSKWALARNLVMLAMAAFVAVTS